MATDASVYCWIIGMLIVEPLEQISLRHLLFILMTTSGIRTFKASEVATQQRDQ